MAGKNEYPLSLVLKLTDKITGPLGKLNAKLKTINEPFGKLGKAFSIFNKESGLGRVFDAFKGVGSSISNVGQEVLGLGLKIAGMAAGAGFALYSIVRGAVNAGDDLAMMAGRVGMGVDAFASLRFAAEQADVSQEEFNTSMSKFVKNLGELKAGGGPIAELLKKVAPGLLQQMKAAKTTEQALSLMTDAFARLPDVQRRAALSTAAFGKGGQQMGEFLHMGSAAVQKLQLDFLRLHGSSEKFANGASDLDNAMRETETAFGGLRDAALGALFPALTKLANAVTDFLVKNRDGLSAWAEKTGKVVEAWVARGGLQELADNIAKIADTTGKLIDKFGGWQTVALVVAGIMAGPLLSSLTSFVGFVLSAGSAITQVLVKAVMLLWPALVSLGTALAPFIVAAAPFILAAVGIGAAAYEIYKNWGPLKEFFVGLWDSITGAFTRAWDKIKPIVDAVMAAAKLMAMDPLEALKQSAEGWASLFSGGSSNDAARPTLNTAAALPASASAQSEARVQVDFANLPKGTRVTLDPNSTADVDLSRGYSMVVTP
jgi:hypothetical protein